MKRTMALMCLLIPAVLVPVGAGARIIKETKTVPRYISGGMNGVFTFEYWGSGMYDFFTIGEATGNLSHLGKSVLTTKHQPLTTGVLRDGTFKLVAANGDEISGTYTGTFSLSSVEPLQYHGLATLVIAGGTGRFANASGTLNATFLETFDANWNCTVTWLLSGTADY